MNDTDSQGLKVSVRALVELCQRSGDLVLDVWESINPTQAIRAHQKIQRSRPKEYTPEVTISSSIERRGHKIEINGRIDGVFVYPDRVIIEEIKTTRSNLQDVTNRQNTRHWAQTNIYAYLYILVFGTERVESQLTYYHLPTDEVVELHQYFEKETLREFFEKTLDRFLDLQESNKRWISTRDESITLNPFPYPEFRPGQREMAAAIFRTIREKGRILVQAPTGIGKTIAALFPAVKSLPFGHTNKIFYLTARNTGKEAAETALFKLRNAGIKLRFLTLTAKEKICFNPELACNGEECSFARGYYDRVDSAIEDLVQIEEITRQEVETIAKNHVVCPFELSLELVFKADCLICDYNYVFDPGVYLRRVFEEPDAYTFLVDEAHNLVDRSREMYSAELVKSDCLALRRQIRGELPSLAKRLERINRTMLKSLKQCRKDGDTLVHSEPPGDLLPSLRNFTKDAERILNAPSSREYSFRDDLRGWTASVNRFLRVAEGFDTSFATIREASERDLRIRLFCLDPAQLLQQVLNRSDSSVFFSATLSPSDYYIRILGLGESAKSISIPTPFPAQNLRLIVHSTLSTKYHQRRFTADSVVEALAHFVRQKSGNYLLFFPSYEYLGLLEPFLRKALPEVRLIVQEPEMPDESREFFLGNFAKKPSETLVGLAILGGIFGEGIDLTGERLSGAAIVSVGLPAVSIERELIRSYFEENELSGFQFAYSYPGMNRVLQAAGRVIRSESDRGSILLVDERYAWNQYRQLFPREWSPIWIKSTLQISAALDYFWNGSGGSQRLK